MLNKVWDEITYPFPNFNGCTIEVWEWISNFISNFLMVITRTSLHLKLPAIWLLVQQLIQTNNKENIKTLLCRPFVGGNSPVTVVCKIPWKYLYYHIDGLVQEICNSIANALTDQHENIMTTPLKSYRLILSHTGPAVYDWTPRTSLHFSWLLLKQSWNSTGWI